MQTLSVALVQMRMSDDLAANTDRAEAFVREAAAHGATLVCLPELFRSPYFCQTEDHDVFALGEAVPGPTTRRFEAVAQDLGVTVLLSLFEKRAEGLYHNTLAVVRPDGYAGKYRKMHIPDDPLFYEKFYFTPGDLGFKVFDVPASPDEARIGTLVCWDQWYPEAARLTAMQGASVLFYPTAIGWMAGEEPHHVSQHDAWETIQRSHAVANGCFVCSVNRIGFEATPGGTGPDDGIAFWGQSFIVGPDGQVLARASADQEEILYADLDLARIGPHRTTWPFLRDRRIDAYAPITQRYLDGDQ